MKPTVIVSFLVMLAAALVLGAPVGAASAAEHASGPVLLAAAPLMATTAEDDTSGAVVEATAGRLDAGPLLIAAAVPAPAAGTAITATAMPATAAAPDPPVVCPPGLARGPELDLYAWLTAIHATVGVDGLESSVDLSISDVLDMLKSGAMLHYESGGPTSVLLDVLYAKLGKTEHHDETTVDFDVKQWLVEAGVLFGGKGSARGYAQWLAGGRYVSFDNSLSLTPPGISASASKSWAEPFVGGRYGTALSDRWSARVTGDIGGFSVGSKFTWEAAVVFGYQMTPKVALGLGYRYININYDKSGFKFDGSLGGPVIGFGFAL
jgi:hypothetical protein